MEELRYENMLLLNQGSVVDEIFNSDILPGAKLYESIIYKLPKNCMLYLCPYVGTGDVYLVSMYFKAYAKKNGHENFCVIVIGKANYKVASLFKFEYIISVTQEEADSLVRLYMMLGENNNRIKMMHHDPPQIWCGILENFRNINNLHFIDLYMANVFHLDSINDRQLPYFDYNSKQIDEIFKENKLKENNTVILSPYVNTLPPLPWWVWVNLAEKIKKRGYVVCTNIGGPQELPINGTIPLQFGFDISVPLLEKCGYFVGIRSGLCDIISSARCKKIIIYQPYLFWGHGTNYDYFSLNKIGFCSDAIEVSYEGVEFLELIDEILKSIPNKGEKNE